MLQDTLYSVTQPAAQGWWQTYGPTVVPSLVGLVPAVIMVWANYIAQRSAKAAQESAKATHESVDASREEARWREELQRPLLQVKELLPKCEIPVNRQLVRSVEIKLINKRGHRIVYADFTASIFGFDNKDLLFSAKERAFTEYSVDDELTLSVRRLDKGRDIDAMQRFVAVVRWDAQDEFRREHGGYLAFQFYAGAFLKDTNGGARKLESFANEAEAKAWVERHEQAQK